MGTGPYTGVREMSGPTGLTTVWFMMTPAGERAT